MLQIKPNKQEQKKEPSLSTFVVHDCRKGILLSLLQQLACDISNDTSRKLSWMMDTVIKSLLEGCHNCGETSLVIKSPLEGCHNCGETLAIALPLEFRSLRCHFQSKWIFVDANAKIAFPLLLSCSQGASMTDSEKLHLSQ